jgi:Carboxypeptidase regulatory-like domain
MKTAARALPVRCALALALFCLAIYAQSSSVNGTVSDPSGALVPNVSLTLTNMSTATQRSVVTDAQGRFTFDAVVPGTYRLQAKSPSFAEMQIESIEVLVNEPVTIPIQFSKVGTTAETISVAASTDLVNTVDATIGNAIESNQIVEIPSYARNVATLLTFQPGVNQSGNVNGGKSDQGNITLDGADVNNQNTRAAMSSVLNITMDSVQEFRVTTTNGNADEGRTSGAQITFVTKSGTNQLHGSLYEYRRGTETAANDFFNNASALPKPALLINIFGGSAGGPIKKNKIFGFFNYEARRDASANSAVRTVPTPTADLGEVLYKSTSGAINTITPAQIQSTIDGAHIGVDPAVLSLFKLYPAGNDTTTGDLLNTMGYRFNSPAHNVQNTYISRFDWNVDDSGKHMIFVRAQLQDYWKNNSPEFPGQPPASVSLDNSKGLAAGYTTTIKPNLISTLRYGFTRYGTETTGVLNGNYAYFRNISTIYPTSTDSVRLIPVHNFSEDIAWAHGSHDLHFGGVVRLISNESSTLGGTYSDAYGNASWMLNTGKELQPADLASSFRTSETYAMVTALGLLPEGDAHYNYKVDGSTLGAGQPIVRNFKNNEFEWYISDTWRVARNFTVTAGLRHSIMPPPHEANGTQTSSIPGLDVWLAQRDGLAASGQPQSLATPVQFVLANSPQGKPLYPNHLKDFAPRLALAYSPHARDGLAKFLFGGEGKTSIRAGFGVFYDLIGQPLATAYSSSALGFSTSLSNPAGVQSAVTSPRYTGFYNIPAGLLPVAPAGGFPQTQPSIFQITNSIDPSLKPPYTMNMDFSIGREFSHGWFVQGSYVGRLSRRSLAHRDVAEPTNLVDTKSGQTYFQAAQALAIQGNKGVATSAVAKIPFWEDLFPGLAGNGLTATQEAYNIYNNYAPDYTSALVQIDQACSPSCSIFGPYALFNAQYSALSTFSSVGKGSYQGMQWTLRKRMSSSLTLDFNYTFSKSEDLSSSNESGSTYGGLIQNIWFPQQMWGVSDYDARHVVSTFAVWHLPVGRNKALLSDAHGVVEAILGGWMLTPTLQWSSYVPTSVGDGSNWATDWNLTTNADQIAPVSVNVTKNAPAITGAGGVNLFSNPTVAFNSFGFALPGESGTRNDLREPGPFAINLSLAKEFTIHENHKLQFRWESYNLTNTPVFNAFSLSLGTASTFGKATSDAGPRQMEFALRYSF